MKIFISVEGQTEHRFVKDILVNHFSNRGKFIFPKIIPTRHNPKGKDFQGGISNYSQVRKEIQNLLQDTSLGNLTTMYDFYGIPKDIPGYSTRKSTTCYQKVEYLENCFKEDIDDSRFHPYFQLHEFEAFLFINSEITNQNLPGKNINRELERIKTQFTSPEEINSGRNTHPSKRIKDLYPEYEKEDDGNNVTSQLGLQRIREACPHFNQWITWLEEL